MLITKISLSRRTIQNANRLFLCLPLLCRIWNSIESKIYWKLLVQIIFVCLGNLSSRMCISSVFQENFFFDRTLKACCIFCLIIWNIDTRITKISNRANFLQDFFFLPIKVSILVKQGETFLDSHCILELSSVQRSFKKLCCSSSSWRGNMSKNSTKKQDIYCTVSRAVCPQNWWY